MWQNKISGGLGIWIVALAFLGFSESLQRILLILTGLGLIVIGFWGKKLVGSEEMVDGIKPEIKDLPVDKQEPEAMITPEESQPRQEPPQFQPPVKTPEEEPPVQTGM